MVKNSGKVFEKLTQEVYQSFCDFEYQENGFKRINVQHNVKIKGKSGAIHQIDVYWEFSLAGVCYKTLVEVKDWKNPVEKEQILSLKSKIDDINNASGIFVSRSGFQEGAKIYANYNGIKLMEINEKKGLDIKLNFITTHYDGLKILVDFAELQKSQIKFNDLKKSLYQEELSNLIVIKPNKLTERLFDLMCFQAEPFYYAKDNIRYYFDETLEGEWYLFSNKNKFPIIKIAQYSFYSYNTSESYLLTIKNIPIICIKEVLTDKIRHYNKESKTIVECCNYRINI